MKFQLTLAASARGPLVRCSQNWVIFWGSTNASNASATEQRISIVALATRWVIGYSCSRSRTNRRCEQCTRDPAHINLGELLSCRWRTVAKRVRSKDFFATIRANQSSATPKALTSRFEHRDHPKKERAARMFATTQNRGPQLTEL